MADVFDQIHAQASGDVFDQIHASSAAPLSWLDQAKSYVNGVLDNLHQTGQGMVDAVTHPLNTLAASDQASRAVAQKAIDAFKSGDYAGGLRHAVLSGIPFLGPGIDALADEAGSGKPGALAHSLGGATSLGLQLAAPGALGEAAPAIGAAADTAGRVVNAGAAGVKAAAPGMAGGAAMMGGGEVLSHIPGMEWPARIGMGYPGVRMMTAAGGKGLAAAKAAWAGAPEAAAVPDVAPGPSGPIPTGPDLSGPSVADTLRGEAQTAAGAAAPPVEDTALLEGILGKPIAKASAIELASARSVMDRIQHGISPEQAAPAYARTFQSSDYAAPAPSASEPASVAPQPLPSVASSPQPAAAAPPSAEEMAAAFQPDDAANASARAQSAANGQARIEGARNAWAQEMAKRVYAGGKGATPEEALQFSPADLDAIAANKGRSPLPPASKSSAETLLRMHQALFDIWNGSRPASAPPVGFQPFRGYQ